MLCYPDTLLEFVLNLFREVTLSTQSLSIPDAGDVQNKLMYNVHSWQNLRQLFQGNVEYQLLHSKPYFARLHF